MNKIRPGHGHHNAEYLQCCLDLLDRYWDKFCSLTNSLRAEEQLAEGRPDLDEMFSQVQDQYLKNESWVCEHHSRLSQSGSANFSYAGSQASLVNVSLPSRTPGSTMRHASLPRLRVPDFHGDKAKWESFRDMYLSVIHHNEELPNIEKFFYLQSYLKGDAGRALEGIQVSDRMYEAT